MWGCFFILGLFARVESSNAEQTPNDSPTFSVPQPWHLYEFPSSISSNFSLLDSSIRQSISLCHKITHLIPFDECLGLGYQSHRTLRQFHFASALETYFNVSSSHSLEFSLLLAFSYGLESCRSSSFSPSHLSPPPLDLCFFGNISPSVILFALLSCPHYQISVFNFDRLDLFAALSQFRLHFPTRSIKWIYGSYQTFFPSPTPPPQCNYIIIDENSSRELSLLALPPVPSPRELFSSTDKEEEEEGLLSPCRGNGMIVHFRPFQSTTRPGTGTLDDGVSVLTSAYQRRGIVIDWRMETIATDLTENVSIRDYEGGSTSLPLPPHGDRVPVSSLSSR
jgi:hypothetical protein